MSGTKAKVYEKVWSATDERNDSALWGYWQS